MFVAGKNRKAGRGTRWLIGVLAAGVFAPVLAHNKVVVIPLAGRLRRRRFQRLKSRAWFLMSDVFAEGGSSTAFVVSYPR